MLWFLLSLLSLLEDTCPDGTSLHAQTMTSSSTCPSSRALWRCLGAGDTINICFYLFWHGLSVLPSLVVQLHGRDEDPRQVREGSLRAFAVVLAMKHCKGFAEHVCIVKPKHFKDFLMIFWGQGSIRI